MWSTKTPNHIKLSNKAHGFNCSNKGKRNRRHFLFDLVAVNIRFLVVDCHALKSLLFFCFIVAVVCLGACRQCCWWRSRRTEARILPARCRSASTSATASAEGASANASPICHPKVHKTPTLKPKFGLSWAVEKRRAKGEPRGKNKIHTHRCINKKQKCSYSCNCTRTWFCVV